MWENDDDIRAQRLDEVERLLARGEAPAALQTLQSLAPESRADGALRLRRVELMDACGQSVRALLELQSMCAHGVPSSSHWTQLGFMLLRFERLDAASQAFRRAVDLAPEDPVHWEALASIEQVLGRVAQATQMWEELLLRHPEDPVALSAL